jgi:hypothetical protein
LATAVAMISFIATRIGVSELSSCGIYCTNKKRETLGIYGLALDTHTYISVRLFKLRHTHTHIHNNKTE